MSPTSASSSCCSRRRARPADQADPASRPRPARRASRARQPMALTEDQRALLRLLLAGDTYEQVADVLGTDAADVRDRAHAAAAELEASGDAGFSSEEVNRRLDALEGRSGGAEITVGASARGGDRKPWLLWLALGAAGLGGGVGVRGGAGG